MQGTTALIVCEIRGFSKGFKNIHQFPYLTPLSSCEYYPLCPASSRTVDSFSWSQLSTDFSCLSVEFQRVVTEAGILRCPNSISDLSLKVVLVWSKELNLEALVSCTDYFSVF